MNNTNNTFTNLVYGSRTGTRNNNCYAWAIGNYRESGEVKLQPGDLSGTSGGSLTCANLKRQAFADATAQKKSMTRVMWPRGGRFRCGKSAYGIMLFTDPNRDYHWYRQHKHVLYRLKTPTTVAELAKRFKVSPKAITAPSLNVGSLVLIRNAWVWSHKRGLSGEGPVLVDALGEIIFDPRKASRDYGDLNYTQFCGAFCRGK